MGLPGKPGSMDKVDMGSMKGQKGDQGEKGKGQGRAACLTRSSAVPRERQASCACLLSGHGHCFFCDVQGRLDRLVIKDPGETLEPQECQERTARRDIRGSQVQSEVQVHHVAGAHAKEMSPSSFHRH